MVSPPFSSACFVIFQPALLCPHHLGAKLGVLYEDVFNYINYFT